jgi:hypothetical protein
VRAVYSHGSRAIDRRASARVSPQESHERVAACRHPASDRLAASWPASRRRGSIGMSKRCARSTGRSGGTRAKRPGMLLRPTVGRPAIELPLRPVAGDLLEHVHDVRRRVELVQAPGKTPRTAARKIVRRTRHVRCDPNLGPGRDHIPRDPPEDRMGSGPRIEAEGCGRLPLAASGGCPGRDRSRFAGSQPFARRRRRRRATIASGPKPTIVKAKVDGSGTGASPT